MTVPSPTGSAPTGSAPTGSAPTGPTDPRLRGFDIPEAYKSEAWAKEVKDIDDLWSKMAGAQKLIGKDKIVFPGPNATPEEITAFHVKLGRPENPEGYEFQNIEDLKEVDRNVELDHGMKKIFFEEGIPKEVGERIVQKYEALVYEFQKPAIAEAAQREETFQSLANEVLGENRNATIEAFKEVMKQSLGNRPQVIQKIDALGNEELLTLVVLGKTIHDKYAGESRIPAKGQAQGTMTGDLKTDYQYLSQQKLNIKTDPNMPEHIKKMKIANLNAQMMQIGAKAGELGVDLFK